MRPNNPAWVEQFVRYSLAGVVLLLIACTACAGPSSQGSPNCGEGVCVKVDIVEPVRRNEPMTVEITVTTDKDTPGLAVALFHDPDTEVEELQGLEKDTVVRKGQSDLEWKAPTKAKQPLSFTRRIKLPSRDGNLGITVRASIPNRGPVASDSVTIALTRTGGTVYRAGTSIPTPLTPIRAVTLSATPVPRTPTRAPYP